METGTGSRWNDRAGQAVGRKETRLSTKLIRRAGIGFLTGVALFILFTGLEAVRGDAPTPVPWMEGKSWAKAVEVLVSGLYGAAAMCGTCFYEIEHWSLAMSSAAHYLLIAVMYVPIGLLFGWARGPVDLLRTEGLQFAVYFLTWLVMYLRYKGQVRRLNKKVREIQKYAEKESLNPKRA